MQTALGEGGRDLVGLGAEQKPAGDHAAAGWDGLGEAGGQLLEERREQVRRDRLRGRNRLRPQIEPPHLELYAVERGVGGGRVERRGIVVDGQNGVVTKLGGGDGEHPGTAAKVHQRAGLGKLEQYLETQAGRRVRSCPKRVPRVDHDVERGPGGCLPRRPDGKPLADQHRAMKSAPALAPVVGDLAGADVDQRAAGGGLQVRQRGHLAGGPVHPVLDHAVAGGRLLDAVGDQLEQLGEHELGMLATNPDPDSDQA